MHFSQTDGRYSLCGLTRSGRMMLEAIRHAPAGAAATLACFVDVCGEQRGRPCFVVFLQIIHSLALYGRRRMRVGGAKWPILTHDEVALLRCVDAAIQDEAALAVHVEWVVRRHGARELTAYLRTFASLMPETMFGDSRAPILSVVGDGEEAAVAPSTDGEKAGVAVPASAFSPRS
jgi:hypothetical protein